jgi:hypothetical protein
MPRAARATPYIAAMLKVISTVAERQKIGMMFDMYPRARPLMMLVAAS